MKPRLLFVHGIGGPRRADDECRLWTGALAEGMARAGHSRLSEELTQRSEFDISFVGYQDLFTERHAQGGLDALGDTTAVLLHELFGEMLAARQAEDVDEATAPPCGSPRRNWWLPPTNRVPVTLCLPKMLSVQVRRRGGTR